MPPNRIRALEVLPLAMLLGIGFGACDRDTPSATSSTTRTTSGTVPFDQGNDPDDLATTQRIRKALIADDAISSDAKSVKVITEHGVVTLRGPVRSAEEHLKVARIAETLGAPNRVNDELDVEQPK
jgi:osmotically-inducible protein OsmY